MITAIRKYLIQDSQLLELLNNKPSIYFVIKPKEATETEYVVYTYKLLSGGFIKEYQLTIQCIGKDLVKLMQIQERIEYLLDIYRFNRFIKDENHTIRAISLLNGGGQLFDETSGNYILVSYFLFKI